MSSRHYQILALDKSGLPKNWISQRDAIINIANEKVGWSIGEDEFEAMFRGGINRISGQLSTLVSPPIIALKNDSSGPRRMGKIPTLTNQKLFRRDNFQCAYCNQVYKEHLLTRDHVHPTSRGGHDTWDNVVSACRPCNHYKDDRLLSQLDMSLGYNPYTPNHAEDLLLKNFNMANCQVNYLLNYVSEKSRIHQYLERFNYLELA